ARAHVTVRGPGPLRFLPPGAAPDHTLAAQFRVFWLPSCAIGRGTRIIFMITVLNPLPNVSYSVVQSKSVGLKRTHRPGLLAIPLAAAPIAVRHALYQVIPPPIFRLCSSSGGILPFGFCRQPIAFARLLGQPLPVGVGIFPRHVDNGSATAAPILIIR